MIHFSEDDSRFMAGNALNVVRNACGGAVANIYILRRGGVQPRFIASMKGLSVSQVEEALAAADNALVDDDAARHQIGNDVAA